MLRVMFCLLSLSLIAVTWAFPMMPMTPSSHGRQNRTRPACPSHWSTATAMASGTSMAVMAFDPSSEAIYNCACKPRFQCMSGMNGGGMFGMISEKMTGTPNGFDVFPISGRACPRGSVCCCSDMQSLAMENAATNDFAASMAAILAMSSQSQYGRGMPGSQSLANNPMFWSSL